jgi:hypothetical protein
MKLFFLD